ncbi:unnamed protein product [Protopolystoma xenopodis]|uniref:Uncharacterized protein n=1 Tax=Protopolystoma xenopodis TaxID=117903 RepID=A0A3S5FEY7_9PLAT|nr:unnamed protein product [Protopolystoma xenopodis]
MLVWPMLIGPTQLVGRVVLSRAEFSPTTTDATTVLISGHFEASWRRDRGRLFELARPPGSACPVSQLSSNRFVPPFSLGPEAGRQEAGAVDTRPDRCDAEAFG